MAIQTPSCCDSEWQLLFKILQSLPDIGDVTGPDSATDNNIAVFDGATGKLIKDSGVSIFDVITTSDLQSGSTDIGNGVDTISVVFGTAFSGVPAVVVSISRPAGEDMISVNLDEASITAAGFTASLGATTASANYKIKWMAKI